MYYQGQVPRGQHLQKPIVEPHIDSVCKKADTTTLLSSCPAKIKVTSYMMLVRPQVAYMSTVWGPHIKKKHKSNKNSVKEES